MKQKAVAAGGGAGVGFLLGNITPHDGLQIAQWIQQSLGPVGFVSFFFNIAQAVALYCTVTMFANRDDQKRQDIKEAFNQMGTLVEKMHNAMDKYTEAVSDLRVAFAGKGIVTSSQGATVKG